MKCELVDPDRVEVADRVLIVTSGHSGNSPDVTAEVVAVHGGRQPVLRLRLPSGRVVTHVPARRVLRLLVSALIIAALAPAAASGAATKTHPVSIYAPRGVTKDCARVQALKRLVTGPELLRGALQALLAGPTKSERARGYGGWFSARTAGHLRSVRIANGVAYVDFRNFAAHVPNASTSCGSTLLLSQLDRTATQFPNIERAVYSFDGSRSAFYAWLQRTAPP